MQNIFLLYDQLKSPCSQAWFTFGLKCLLFLPFCVDSMLRREIFLQSPCPQRFYLIESCTNFHTLEAHSPYTYCRMYYMIPIRSFCGRRLLIAQQTHNFWRTRGAKNSWGDCRFTRGCTNNIHLCTCSIWFLILRLHGECCIIVWYSDKLSTAPQCSNLSSPRVWARNGTMVVLDVLHIKALQWPENCTERIINRFIERMLWQM